MAACPSCGGEISGGSCTRCGAKAALALDVPDLDLTPMSTPRVAPRAAPNPAPKSAPSPARAAAPMAALPDDVLAHDMGEQSFELDAPMPQSPPISSQSLPAPSSGRTGGAPVDGVRISATPVSVSAPPPYVSGAPPRMSAAPEDEKPRIDPLEAKALADYGEPPTKLLETPLYAFKVKMRQSELRRELWRAKLAFERSQKERSAAEADSTRLEEVRLRLTAEVAAKEHEVDLHEAALLAHDAAALKRGVQLASAAAFVLFVLIAMPIFFRMCIGVDAPPLPP